ncbi:MAG: hypothetical protein ISP49_08720, partial [Reyranella sp.]|nr:hypothetical protein [Reyranella sp.]
MSLPPSGFKPDQIGLVDMGDISFYDAHSVTPVFNPWEMGPYAASFGEIVLNVTWDALQPTATSLSTTLIDNAISQLNQFNAQYGTDIGIKLRVWGGFRAPEWAKELGGPPITITGQGAVDPGDYTDQTIGRFWTTDYISAWLGLQNQLAQIYDNNPIIRGISQTAGASATDEPFVPLHGDAPVSAVSNATVNQPALLEAGGYRDAADALTLRAAIASYSQWSTTPLDFTFNNHYLFDSGGHADPNFTLAVLQQARNATRVVQAGNHALRDPLYSADLIVYNQLAADAALKPSIAPNSFQTAAPITFFPAFSDWQAAIADGVALNAGNIELWDFPTTPVVTGFTGLSPAQVQALAAVLAAGTPPPTTYAPDDSSALGFIAPAIVSGAPGTVALTGTNAVLLASTSSLGTYSVVLTSINGNMLGLTDFTGTVIGATTGSTLALSGTLAQINTVLAHLTDSVGSGNDIVQFVATDSSGDVSVRDVGVLATTPPASAAVPTPGTLPAQQSFSISGGNARVVAQGSMASLDIAAGFGNSGMLVLGGVQSSLNVTGNLTVDGNTSLFAQLSPNAYSTATLKVGGAFDVQSGATAFLSGQFTAGQFTNELGGTIRASGQLVSGNGTILNNGMIEATADQTLGATRLVINNSLTHSGAGTGTLQIDAGATLVLNGAVTSQTIKFASNTVTQLANSPYAPSTLVISNAPALSGVTINGFTFADKLVLPNVNITGQAAPTYDSASNTLTVHRQGASDLTFTIDNADLTGLSVNGVYNPLTNQTAITFVAPAGGISPTISVAGSSGPGVPGTLRGGAVGSQTLVPEVVLQAPLTAGADPTTTMFKLEVQVLDGGAVGVSGQTPQTTIVRTDTIANLEGYLETLIYETRTSAID